MDASRAVIRWNCQHCDWEERTGTSGLASKLRLAGLLKREDERDLAVLLELAAGARARIACPECGSLGLSAKALDEEDEWGTPVKKCAACAATIPPERVELFPAAELCAACQKRIDAGGSPDAHDDFCPHCGTRMVVRQKRSSGLTRYEQVCPACKR